MQGLPEHCVQKVKSPGLGRGFLFVAFEAISLPGVPDAKTAAGTSATANPPHHPPR